MDKYPLVTIITPVYNQSKYVGETIESVLSQDYCNLEYLVINDGSTDNTTEVLQRYTNRINWKTHQNIGETATVNLGAKQAKGEIIGIVNSDDPLLPGAINEMVKFFLHQPELIVVYPDWQMIDAEGKVIEIVKTFNYNYQNMLRWHYCLPGPGALIKKELFLSIGGRDPNFRFVADYDFWLRAGLLGNFARIPKVLASYRRYDESTTSAMRGIEMAEEHIRLVNKIYSLPNLPDDLISIKNEAFSSANYIAGVVCGSNTKRKTSYFLSAIKYSPKKYFGEYRFRILEILFGIFISPRMRKVIKKLPFLVFRNKV